MKLNQLKRGQCFVFNEIQNEGEPFATIRRVINIAARPGIICTKRVTNQFSNDWFCNEGDMFFLSKHGEREVIVKT
tara:strand:- start:50 stop:277 length:228 start_codon:yes stop_codon:yes gene_type:complete